MFGKSPVMPSPNPEVHCAYSKLLEIGKLKPHPKNPNKHNDKQIVLLSKIIEKTGWRNPIVVSNLSGLITKGHGRLQAAQLLGVKKVPVDYQDYVDEAQELTDMVADNRIAELAQIDNDILRGIMKELEGFEADLDLTGFGKRDIEKLFEGIDKDLNLNPSPNNAVAPMGTDGLPLPSHVRMVQLFFNVDSQPAFLAAVKRLQAEYKTSNITETVFQAVKNEADRLKN